MCEDCIYPQAKVAMNYGATKEEILETIEICIITGGVPTFSVAKGGIGRPLQGEGEVEKFSNTCIFT